MTISIIVPIYNKEPYLVTLFDSILSQGLDDSKYEIILIDDGPTDSSNTCCQFRDKHPELNITYIYQNNHGVSVARNRGILYARGKYIHFVDSDDFLVKNSYRYILDNFALLEADYIGFSLEW